MSLFIHITKAESQRIRVFLETAKSNSNRSRKIYCVHKPQLDLNTAIDQFQPTDLSLFPLFTVSAIAMTNSTGFPPLILSEDYQKKWMHYAKKKTNAIENY